MRDDTAAAHHQRGARAALRSSLSGGKKHAAPSTPGLLKDRPKERTVLTVDVPLAPSIDTVDDDALHKVLLSEYTCRYLEKIGAKPTRANMELVRRNLPLTKDCLKVQLKTRGAIKDEVSIVVPPVAYDVKPPEVSLAPPLKKVLLMSSLARVAAGTTSEPGTSGTGGGASDIDPLFEEVDPLTMIDNSTKENKVRAQRSSSAATVDRASSFPGEINDDEDSRLGQLGRKVLNRGCITYEPGRGRGSSSSGAISGRRMSMSFRSSTRKSSMEEARQMLQAELKIEMSQEFVPRDDDFVVHHRSFSHAMMEWKRQQPRLTIRTSLRSELMKFTLAEVGGEAAMSFFKEVVVYFYNNYISPPEVPDFRESQALHTVRLQEDFLRIRARCQAFKGGLSFTLPVFLLSLRVFTKRMFIVGFPLWTQTEEGIETLSDMNDTITELFDPHGYFSSLSIIESTSGAVKIMRQHPHLSHRPLTKHLNDTSPLLRSIVVSPQCRETRIMLNSAKEGQRGVLRGNLRQDVHRTAQQEQKNGVSAGGSYSPLHKPLLRATAQGGSAGGRADASVSHSKPIFDKPKLRPSEMDVEDYDALLRIHRDVIRHVPTPDMQLLKRDQRSLDWLLHKS